jgi:hypothetical protein
MFFPLTREQEITKVSRHTLFANRRNPPHAGEYIKTPGGVGRPWDNRRKTENSPRLGTSFGFLRLFPIFLALKCSTSQPELLDINFNYFSSCAKDFPVSLFPPLKCPHETPLASLSRLEIDSFSHPRLTLPCSGIYSMKKV